MSLKVLVLISEYPLPPNSGPKVRNASLWNELSHLPVEIKILALHDPKKVLPLKAFTSLETKFFKKDRPPFLKKLWRYLNYSHHQYFLSKELSQEIINQIENWRPDIIHAEELKMAQFLPRSKSKNVRYSVTLHNVESELIKHTGSFYVPLLSSLVAWWHGIRLKRYEHETVHRVDHCFAYSDEDKVKLQTLYPEAKISSTSNGADVYKKKHVPIKNKNAILFVGSLHYVPNFEGILWFIENVLPKIETQVQLIVAGAGAPENIKQRLQDNHIIFHDSPDSLEDIYHDCTLSIVPIFKGSGTRTKIFESLAYGRPVISTTLGSEGIPIHADAGLFKADSAEGFISTILDLLQNHTIEDLNELGLKSIRAVSVYDWSNVARRLYESWKNH